MTEIDWESAKSGKRPIRRKDGTLVRYVGALDGGRYVVAVRNSDGSEYSLDYLSNGERVHIGQSALSLTQDPEVIEFKRWVNVSQHYVEGLFDDPLTARMSASPGCLATVPTTIRITGDKVGIFGGTE